MSSIHSVPETTGSAGQESKKFRSQMGQISRHSAVFFAGTMFTAAAGYLFKVYLARVLGAEALGIYALGMTIVGLAGLFGGLGLTWAASRFPASYSVAGKFQDLRAFLWWALLILVLVNGLLAVVTYQARYWIANKLYHAPALANYIHLFVFIMFVGALTTFFAQLLTGFKRVAQKTVITNFAGGILTMVFTIALVSMRFGLWGYIFAQVASAIIVLCLLVKASWEVTPIEARWSLKPPNCPSSEIFSFCVASFSMDLVSFLSSQTDKVILGSYLDPRSVGIYAVAGAIVAFVPLALQSVNQIFSPMIADLHARGESVMLGRLFQVLTKWILGFTGPLAGVVIIFASPMMRIFGRDFEAGWPILVIGTIGQLVNCAVGSVGYLLLMSGNQNRLIRIQAAMGGTMVLLSFLLIPKLGVVGAAVAAAITNIGTNTLSLWEVRRTLRLWPYNRGYLRLVIPSVGAISTAVALRFGLSRLPDLMAVIVTLIAVYIVFVLCWIPLGLDDDDQLIVKAVWSRLPFSRHGQKAVSQ